MTAAVKGASVAQSKEERAARARRARVEGNERQARDAAIKASGVKPTRRRTRSATVTKLPVAKVTIPDNSERQAAAALERLQAAEARRPRVDGQPATATPLQEDLRASRVPTRRRRTATEVAHDQQHLFDLDDALGKMNIDYLQCRDFGHSWKPHTARWIESQGHYESQLRCTRCGTLRTRLLSRTGAQVQGQYLYSEGYLVKGMGRLTGGDRDKVRLRSILSVLK
jgi:hypothetical protein